MMAAMADSSHFTHHVSRGRSSGGAVFARLAQPFIGSSRPPSSSGLGRIPDPTSAPNVLNSRTIRYSLNSPILAISAHVDGDNVVVAEREILRILRVGRNSIEEVSTLRQPGEQRRVFQYDVKWGTLHQKNTIATAGTNGMICLYDVKSGLLDRLLREHGRQVHKIAFNPADGRLLLSASQDGTIKLWDLREKNSRLTFAGRADAVRDVQFNSNNAVEFAAAFDNGTIQRWDYRKDNIYERKINAHNGPAFTVDWHPDGKHCASGGRDRTVKVWDLYAEDPRKKPKHTIATMCSVSRIAWRPRKNGATTELATCAINSDYRVYVWDLKRPYIPARIMNKHLDSTTGILWKDEDILWSCSKDMTLVQNDVVFATQPINSLAHAAFSWGPTDDFTFATQPRGRVRRSGLSSGRFEADEELNRERRPGRSSSFKGLKPALSILETLTDKFVSTQAAARISIPGLFDKEAFIFLAERYKHTLTGEFGEMTLPQACASNARAAMRVQQYRTAQTWKILQMALEWEDRVVERSGRMAASVVGAGGAIVARRALGLTGDASGAATPMPLTPMQVAVPESPARSVVTPTQVRPEPIEEGLLLPPVAFGTSLGSSTASTDGDDEGNAHPIVRSASRNGDDGISSGEASVNYKDKQWTEIQTNSNTSAQGRPTDTVNGFTSSPMNVTNGDVHPYPYYPDYSPQPEADPPTEKRHGRERKYSLVSEATSSSYGTAGFGGRASEEEDDDEQRRIAAHGMEAIQEEDSMLNSGIRENVPELRVGEWYEEDPAERERPWSPQTLVERFADWYCERGDVQMCATVVLLLTGRVKVDERRRDEWVEGYIQLLRRFKLFVPAAEIVRTTTIEPIRAAGGNQTFAKVGCGRCFKPIIQNGSWYCERCQRLQDGCVICRETVKGRWTMCQTCSHGGHDNCLREWFFEHQMDACAAVGCDHECLPRSHLGS